MILNPTVKEFSKHKDVENTTYLGLLKYILWTLKLNFKLLPTIVILRTLYVFYTNVEPILHGYIWGRFIDTLIARDFNNLNGIFILYLVILGLSFVFGVVSNRIDAYGKVYSMFKYRTFFANIISKLGIPSLENAQIGNKIFRVNDSYYDLWGLTQKVSNLISFLITLGISISVVLTGNYLYTFIILFVVILRAVLHGKELKEDWKFTYDHTENKRIGEALINSVLKVESLKELLLSGSNNFFVRRYKRFYNFYYSVIASMRIRKGLVDTVFEIIFVVIIGLLLASFIQGYIQETVTIGAITFYIAAFRTYISSLKGFLASVVVVGEAKDKVKDAYDLSNMVIEDSVRENTLEKGGRVAIELKNVNFVYPNSTHEVISDLNLTIKPGEKIAIVGENGAGKTTLMNLLLSFYPVTSGQILINGIDINTIKLSSWYRKVGMLLQSFNSYDFISLQDNITLGRKKNGRLDKVIKMFDVDEIMGKYSFGLDQLLSPKYTNGISPSGGQWQKIAMARTLFRNTPVVILDEPTSAMDPVSESRIFSNLFEDLKEKTVIIISHRFSTVKKADTIIVMKEGRIVEKGSHAQLLKLDGIYASSYKLQAESYRD